uniref:DUF4062 domain-containing protein n=1 Tax=Anabas testudineus TaxID=64144 RepID=A0AAQ6ILH5_ANATE
MNSERKALLEKAYPEVLSFCRSLGLVFEVVDLRWGIRNVPSGDHESCEIFLQEIERCKRISAGPAFIVSLSFPIEQGQLCSKQPTKLRLKSSTNFIYSP